MFLVTRVRIRNRWGFAFPVPFIVVDELFEALTDLVWVGEQVLKLVPLPQDADHRKHLRWVKSLSPSTALAACHFVMKDLKGHKGLDLVDVEVGDVQVHVHLR